MAYVSVTKKVSCYRETECGQNLNHSKFQTYADTKSVPGVSFRGNEKCF